MKPLLFPLLLFIRERRKPSSTLLRLEKACRPRLFFAFFTKDLSNACGFGSNLRGLNYFSVQADQMKSPNIPRAYFLKRPIPCLNFLMEPTHLQKISIDRDKAL